MSDVRRRVELAARIAASDAARTHADHDELARRHARGEVLTQAEYVRLFGARYAELIRRHAVDPQPSPSEPPCA